MEYTLPSVEECQEFLRVINRGREAIGLRAVDVLAFDACEPGNPLGCLSATHLFKPAGYTTFDQVIRPELGAESALVTTLDLPARTAPAGTHGDVSGFAIPPQIKVVTDVFDDGDDDEDLLAALRDRMVEAGVVDP